MEDYSNFTCFPRDVGGATVFLESFELGFPSKFLITRWWHELDLAVPLFVLAHLQAFACIALFLFTLAKQVDRSDRLRYANHKILPLFTSFWSLVFSVVVLFLPNMWLSNIVMGLTLIHVWIEFSGMVVRYKMIMRDEKGSSTTHNMTKLSARWMIVIMFVLVIPVMLICDPAIQGIIVAVVALPSDLVALILAPYLAREWIRKNPTCTLSEKLNEWLSAALYVSHVGWLYGQGVLACNVSVRLGALFILFFLGLDLVITLALLVVNIKITRDSREKMHPFAHLKLLFCCQWEAIAGRKSRAKYTAVPTSVAVRGEEEVVELEVA